MTALLNPESQFLHQINEIIDKNLSDEQFGVSELAEQMNMSRSSLLRKVKKLTDLSVSVYIREVRLHHAKELLKDDSLSISEIAYKVGFNSVSYFTKCFRESFGYTPGKEKEVSEQALQNSNLKSGNVISLKGVMGSIALVVILSATVYYYFTNQDQEPQVNSYEKTIAVLPFKNDSNDSSNIYIVNGMMEAILDNLTKVKDLKVTSRTTVEKYRTLAKSIPELAQELEVNYFVEGSGQKVGDQLLLTVQLIEAATDQHIWSNRYQRKISDVFQMQAEIAQDIAKEIQVVITPEEQRRIEKAPTQSVAAYDHYLKGIEYTRLETAEGLVQAITSFKSAIAEDNSFAQAYAYVAICYYYLDIFQKDKKHSLELISYSERAMQLDSGLVESLIANALLHIQKGDYELAVVSFENALELAPNSGRIHNFLSLIYTVYLPDTEKFLRHALRGIKMAAASQDSVTASYSYLNLSNALVQTGFLKEAKRYILKSIAHDSTNLYSQYVYTYIKLAENFDLARTKKELLTTLQKDTTRLDIIQEVAKVCYVMEDYEEAWKYYNKFLEMKKALNMDVFASEDVKIGFVLEQLERKEEATKFYEQYRQYAENDNSIYKPLEWGAYYAVMGEKDQAMDSLQSFAAKKDYMYWMVLFLDSDPIINQLKNHPEYDETMQLIKDNFWERHQEISESLKDEGVI